MDQYGSFESTEADAREIRKAIDENLDIVFAWSHNKTDCYIFHISPNFEVLGVMPFGGNPRCRVYVGLYGKGCNHFSRTDTHAGYWQEKLNLDRDGAEAWAEFWKQIWKQE